MREHYGMREYYGHTPTDLLKLIAEACNHEWGNLPNIVKLYSPDFGPCAVPGIDLVSYGDYHGSDLDAANARALVAEFGDVFYRNDGPHGSVSLSIAAAPGVPPFAPPPDPANSTGDWENDWETLASLAATMTRLTDYPLISEEAHAEYINELVTEAWDSWLRSDLLSDLATATGSDDLYEPADELADQVREAYLSFENNEWVAQSATSVVNLRHRDAVRHVLTTVFYLPN